ncbi:AAA family ATPase [Pseudomonas veronii]|uniref:AAA family ATPase n=1 Tax=Pseudomonas veronii TaxID=76761 RepID=A0A7Y1F6A3_PSEVE|nr:MULTISPECIES: ATP-binding protein [Pseudomonas]MBC3240132.1 AAA family ATPase [Pseudomonas lurida]NMY01063.1 AAA family ATPase [Pseudomonas veronii]
MTQFEPVLIVKRLVVIKGAKPVYDERLHPGVNVIRGENASGKSTILNFIYYGLGGDLTDWSAAALLCTRVYLEVELNGMVVTLARDISESSGSPMDMFSGSYDLSLKQPANVWNRYPYRRSLTTESFSQVIFRLLGMPDVSLEVSGNITMHQVLRLLYADQLSPVDEIFRFEQFEQKDTRDTIGRLLCGAYANDLYENSQSLKSLRKEFDKIDSQLRNLFVVLGKAEQEVVTADWLLAEREELLKQKRQVEEEIDSLERKIASISTEPISMREQEECYDFVRQKQVEIAKVKQAIDSLILDIADSNAFVNGLKEKVNNLRDSAVVAKHLEEVRFHSCPACFSILDSEEESMSYACHLCKTPYNSEQVAARIAGLVNESAVQIKQSEVLQGRRRERLLQLEADRDSLGKEWKLSAQKLSSMLKRPSTESQQSLRELQRKLGYIDRMIEDFDQKSKMAGVISSLSQRKVELQFKITSLEDENEKLKYAQQDRLNRAYLLISEEVKYLLHNDLRRQDSFENAKGLSFSFEKNRMTVDGQSYFSASSRAILKSSFFAGFTAAASDEEFFRHPRFCMIDTLENMGVEEVRSQNFQRLLVQRSAKLKAKHQIIYATAMIDPELDNISYTVGRYSTRDEPTIELWK